MKAKEGKRVKQPKEAKDEKGDPATYGGIWKPKKK